MIDQLATNTAQYIQSNPWITPLMVFFGGVLTACAPCVLAMIPLIVSFVAGQKEERPGPGRAFLFTLVFIFGLSVTFTALGMIAALAGKIYGDISGFWNWVVFAVCVIMGLHLMSILNFTIPAPASLQPRTKGVIGALLMGLLFGVVSAPCAGPMLLVLLTYLAGADSSVIYGGLLLLSYSLGHSVLILIAGTSMGAAKKILESKSIGKATDILRKAAGAIIILVGLYFGYKGIS